MKALTKGEEQVMEAIWKKGAGFLKDIIEALPDPKPHSNTVATVIKILIEKKYVVYEAQGRNYLYKPIITREEYAKKSIANVMKNFFGGSPANIVSHFLKEKKITVKEMEDILKQIKSSKK